MRQKRKILVVHPISTWGGASVALLTVLKALDTANNYRIMILFNKHCPALDKISELGYECHVLSYPAIGNAGGRKISLSELARFIRLLPFAAPKFISFIRKGNFDCIYLNTGICLAPALAGKLLGVPVIWHIRELLDSKSILGSLHCNLISATSQLVIANSESSGSAIKDLSKLSIIYDGISDEFIEDVSTEDVQKIRTGWGVSEDAVIVGLVAAISWSKGHFILLEALSKLVNKYPMVRVVFVGGTVTPANYHTTLRARVKKMLGGYSDAEEYLKIKVKEMGLEEYVRFDNWQTGRELVKRVNAMDVMAFPVTIPEGFGRPVAEAALAGKPSIGTDAGSLSELIHHGQTGWLVPIKDSNKLSECIIDAITDLECTRGMGEKARSLALERFTMTIHNQKIRKVFDSVLNKESRA